MLSAARRGVADGVCVPFSAARPLRPHPIMPNGALAQGWGGGLDGLWWLISVFLKARALQHGEASCVRPVLRPPITETDRRPRSSVCSLASAPAGDTAERVFRRCTDRGSRPQGRRGARPACGTSRRRRRHGPAFAALCNTEY